MPTVGLVIIVTRLHGASVAVNCDLIERVEATPDTVLTLVDGSRYVVRESVTEIVEKVRAFRASVVLLAGRLDEHPATGQHLRLVPVPDPDANRGTWACRRPGG
jgi:flagellar protein FlbD